MVTAIEKTLSSSSSSYASSPWFHTELAAPYLFLSFAAAAEYPSKRKDFSGKISDPHSA
jgi:hypothetical protein